jgi:hypothetical protein
VHRHLRCSARLLITFAAAHRSLRWGKNLWDLWDPKNLVISIIMVCSNWTRYSIQSFRRVRQTLLLALFSQLFGQSFSKFTYHFCTCWLDAQIVVIKRIDHLRSSAYDGIVEYGWKHVLVPSECNKQYHLRCSASLLVASALADRMSGLPLLRHSMIRGTTSLSSLWNVARKLQP